MCIDVSVVIPVYNVEDYLNECVNSVVNQTYKNLEIILVDDGSTDKSGQICDEYLNQDSRIKVIHCENGGLSAARNTGMDLASGKYIYFLDSDDYITPQCIEHNVELMVSEAADMTFFDGFVFFTDCEEYDINESYFRNERYSTDSGREVLLELLNNDEYRTPVQFCFFRRAWLSENSLRFYEGIIHEDELFTFQVFNANGTVAHCHEQLYARRIRPASIMTSSGIEKRYYSMLTIYYELANMYRKKEAKGEAATIYLIRAAKSVIAKFKLLDTQQQNENGESYEIFKKSVMTFNGFGDIKLKIKCSGPIMNKFYRGIYKITKNN